VSAPEYFTRIVRWVMRDTTFLRLYSATVELDHLDGTFDVRADDEAIRGLGLPPVPALVGIAGARVNADAGTRCLVGFQDGNPKRPRIVAWEYEPLHGRIVFDDGTAALARQGDHVRCLIGDPAPVAGELSGTVLVPAPPGLPVPTPVPAAPFVGTVTLILPDTVHGAILGGAPRVLG
jgi:hypothetical protein